MSQPGDQFRTAPSFERLDAAVALNRAADAHLWIIAVTYGLTDQEAAHGGEGVDTLLDGDHLLACTPVCCYRCEKPYPEAVGHPCIEVPPHA
jgi:hypothetical protein